jgi:hypothetical protein
LFSTLGVSPIAGRVFTQDEDHPNTPGVAVISTSSGSSVSVQARTRLAR